MRVAMVGMDFRTAEVDIREAFALDGEALRNALAAIRAQPGIAGCAVISTCNRAELYFSYAGETPPDGAAILCAAVGRDVEPHRAYFVERSERRAVRHLFAVAAGLRSSVLGDSQIVTQVRNAVEAARAADAADPVLETLFRYAVTAGKKVRTAVNFARTGNSVAGEAVRFIADRLGDLAGKRALVIGNGGVGRLAAAALTARGCDTAVTRRTCRRNGKPDAPEGCAVVPYDERYAAMSGLDILISATSSPHFTVEREKFAAVAAAPPLLVDLAIPRDIDPETAALPGVTLWNVDAVRRGESDAENRRLVLLAEEILEDEARRFEIWRHNRRRRAQPAEGAPDFPVFINLRGVDVLMVGGGRIAARRAETLLRFGARVRVVSPEVSDEMLRIVERSPDAEWTRKRYAAGDIGDAALAVAATDDRAVNRTVGADARERGVLVSVADRRDECSFYFPAVVTAANLTAGIVSNNGDHGLVRRVAALVRRDLERMTHEDTDWQQGE